MSEFTGLAHIGMFINNTDETVKFYVDLLGGSVKCQMFHPGDDATITMIDMGTFIIEAICVPDEDFRKKQMEITKSTLNHFAVQVNDLKATLENLKSNGFMPEGEIENIELPKGVPSCISFVHGPANERIELYQIL